MRRDEAEFEAAFPTLYRLAYDRAGRLLGGPGPDALDVAQRTLTAALESWDTLTAPGNNIEGWVVTAAHNKAIDLLRSAPRRRETSIDTWTGCSPDFTEQTIDRLDVQKLVAELPEHERTLVTLRYEEDRSVAEVAEILEISRTAVSTRTYRVLKKLRARLEGAIGDERPDPRHA